MTVVLAVRCSDGVVLASDSEALAITAPSVGADVDVAGIVPAGARHLDPAEVEDARTRVERWTEQEQRVLDELLDAMP